MPGARIGHAREAPSRTPSRLDWRRFATDRCRKHRGETRNDVSKSRFAAFVNDDMNVVASKWFDVAISFKATYFAPPDVIEDVPSVITIERNKASHFIDTVGVGTAMVHGPTRAVDQLLSPPKRSRGVHGRKTKVHRARGLLLCLQLFAPLP